MACMSLRNQPTSERIFATLVVLALGAFLAGGLAFTARQERSGTAAAPPLRSRLLAVLEGVMAANTSPGEMQAFRAWVAGGATREGFAPVEAIAANNCSACHGPGGQFPRVVGYEDLRPLALEEASEGLFATLGARGLHLAAFPLVFLAVGFLYVRRIAWPRRRALLAAGVGAVLFDAGQWWLRQGHAGAAWAAWTALGLLAAVYLATAVAVLADLWRRPGA